MGDTTYWLIITCSRTNQGGRGRKGGNDSWGDSLYSSIWSCLSLFFVLVFQSNRDMIGQRGAQLNDYAYIGSTIYGIYDITLATRQLRYSMHCEVLDFWNINVMSNFHFIEFRRQLTSFLQTCTLHNTLIPISITIRYRFRF